MAIRRYDPREGLSLREVMDRLIEDSFVGPGALSTVTSSISAPMDLKETDDGYHVCMDMPGMRPEDIGVTVTGDTVRITGEHRESKDEKQEGYLRHERRMGHVERSFALPSGIDASKVEAEFRDGVLHLQLPKSEEQRPKQVKVKAARDQAAGTQQPT